MSAQGRWKTSRYNFSLAHESKVALYNALTGALHVFEGEDAPLLAEHFCHFPLVVDVSELDDGFVKAMARAGFLVPEDHDELDIVASRFAEARQNTPGVLTITTTQDCNLGCYYCYEKRLTAALQKPDVVRILEFAQKHIEQHQLSQIHVNWYGGEPLLNGAFIEELSPRLQQACSKNNVEYRASIISNGTLWPSDIAGFVSRHAIVQAQISFDGLSRNHNKRRHLRSSHRDADVRTPFERATEVVDALTNATRVEIRLNVDRKNTQDVEAFIDFAVSRGWFARHYPARLQIAKITAYTERTKFLKASELSPEEFEDIRRRARMRIPELAWLDDAASQAAYPEPKSSVCAALAKRSVVIGADGVLYRCGLQVGEKEKGIGALANEGFESRDAEWWDAFDPTKLVDCKVCSFLPVCWGGCPKKHLDQNPDSRANQANHWRTSLPQRILVAAQFPASAYRPFSVEEQFRDRR